MGLNLESSADQATKPPATTMARQESHRQYLPILGHLSRSEIVTTDPENAKLRHSMKAWKYAGRPLKMMVGTGFPSIFSKGRWRREKADMKASQKISSSTAGGSIMRGFIDIFMFLGC
ncbi:hypothetical protein CDL15_Pgr009499 [Punica granatum]|uniref:Uncharacterized protein n=1 Tax=Punica granatum TaxID=22663 RepID=A0A218WST9_PUNGR|nr:hypothetical protein CDL15_Pgr009499 [Punica granatum]PKI64428.1 hypothetical protein CRG98_015153 [Punica granatum]